MIAVATPPVNAIALYTWYSNNRTREMKPNPAPKDAESTCKSILFVCLGNICRSPAAEGVMQYLVDQQGLASQIRVDSAGTAGYHIGKQADPRMRAAAAKRGLDLTSRCRVAVPNDFKQFDLIIAMDRSNYRDLMSLARDTLPNNVKMLSDYLGEPWPAEVPDPYYGGEEGFEFVLDMLQAACPIILHELCDKERSQC